MGAQIIKFRINKFLLTICICIAFQTQSKAQFGEDTMYIRSYNDVLNLTLSDTFVGVNLYLPIKVISEGSSEVKIYSEQTQFIYAYFRQKYGWNGAKFMDTFSNYLINDIPIKIEDTSSFNFNNLITEKECSCKFEMETLNFYIHKGKYPLVRDKIFSCFVYKCLKANVLLSYNEGRIVFSDFRNEIDSN